jgi:hypothetical protein
LRILYYCRVELWVEARERWITSNSLLENKEDVMFAQIGSLISDCVWRVVMRCDMMMARVWVGKMNEFAGVIICFIRFVSFRFVSFQFNITTRSDLKIKNVNSSVCNFTQNQHTGFCSLKVLN